MKNPDWEKWHDRPKETEMPNQKTVYDEIERLQMKVDALIHEQDELVKAIAARKIGARSIESLYEYTALNFPTAWQLSGGNNATFTDGEKLAMAIGNRSE